MKKILKKLGNSPSSIIFQVVPSSSFKHVLMQVPKPEQSEILASLCWVYLDRQEAKVTIRKMKISGMSPIMCEDFGSGSPWNRSKLNGDYQKDNIKRPEAALKWRVGGYRKAK